METLQKARPQEVELTWGFAFSKLLPQWGVSWLSAL